MVTTEAAAPHRSASGIEKKKSSKNKDKKSKKRPVDEVEVRVCLSWLFREALLLLSRKE